MVGASTDLVVVVPGVMGSSLADARGKEIWGLSPGTALRALSTLGRSLQDLTLPQDFAEGDAPDGVVPTKLLIGFHVIPGLWTPVEGYGGLVRFLSQNRFGLILEHPDVAEAPPGNLVLFAYDWRLSNRWTAILLKRRVETALTRWRESAPERCEAKVIFISHSMGGLIARWYLDMDGGAELARAHLTLGTPHRGALKTLDHLVNGVRKGPGPLKSDLTKFARSLPSSYQLLPEYACIEGSDATLLKTTELELPALDSERVADGMVFHTDLDSSATGPYPLLPVVGIGQPTPTTARIVEDRVIPLSTIMGNDRAGDGTVPRLAARPKDLEERDPSIQGIVEGHGSLAGSRSALDQMDFMLSTENLKYRAAETPIQEQAEQDVLGLSVPALHEAGQAVEVTALAGERRILQAVALDELGREISSELVRFDTSLDGMGRSVGTASFERLDPGGYTFVVQAPDDPAGFQLKPVRAMTLVWADA